MADEEYTFKMQRIGSQMCIDRGLLIAGGRFKRKDFGVMETMDAHMIRMILDVATQEEDLCRYPADWWQALKERWFPEWLKRKTPVVWTEVIAMHKFPELVVPDSVLGREFVNLKIVEAEELIKKDEK